MNSRRLLPLCLSCSLLALLLGGCRSLPRAATRTPIPGDEIIVAGQRFHTGTRVVTWQEPGGYNGYTGMPPRALRKSTLPEADKQRLARDGWDLPSLQQVVDQFVLHYDVCGVSKVCFDVLTARKLGVHFMLDVDGTIYQTVDLDQRAPHATIANDRSIGIEIANIGAYPPDAAQPLADWYRREPGGATTLTIPAKIKDPRVRTPDFTGHPARPEPVRGVVQGLTLVQYDFTPEQYAALTKLAAALCRIFPRLPTEYPHAFFSRDATPQKLSDAKLARFHGILGHYHIQANKTDPGPAFDWPRFIADLRRELR